MHKKINMILQNLFAKTQIIIICVAVRIDDDEEETQGGSGYMVIPYDHSEFISDLSANSSFQSASPSLPNGSDNNGIQPHDAWQGMIELCTMNGSPCTIETHESVENFLFSKLNGNSFVTILDCPD